MGLPEPTYEEAGGSFVTVFHNPKPEQSSKGSEISSEKGSEKSSERVISEIRKILVSQRKSLRKCSA